MLTTTCRAWGPNSPEPYEVPYGGAAPGAVCLEIVAARTDYAVPEDVAGAVTKEMDLSGSDEANLLRTPDTLRRLRARALGELAAMPAHFVTYTLKIALPYRHCGSCRTKVKAGGIKGCCPRCAAEKGLAP